MAKIIAQYDRSNMKAYKRAINGVLATRPVSDSPVLMVDGSASPHLLAALDEYINALDQYDVLAIARRDTVEYIRLHSDIQTLKESIGVSDEWLDQLFLDAMATEQLQ